MNTATQEQWLPNWEWLQKEYGIDPLSAIIINSGLRWPCEMLKHGDPRTFDYYSTGIVVFKHPTHGIDGAYRFDTEGDFRALLAQHKYLLLADVNKQIPVVVVKIASEADFILPASDWYAMAADKTGGDPLVNVVDLRILDAFCREYQFAEEDIEGVDFSQTRTKSQLDALPEWGSF